MAVYKTTYYKTSKHKTNEPSRRTARQRQATTTAGEALPETPPC